MNKNKSNMLEAIKKLQRFSESFASDSNVMIESLKLLGVAPEDFANYIELMEDASKKTIEEMKEDKMSLADMDMAIKSFETLHSMTIGYLLATREMEVKN